ncbi:hypothetical protein C0389_10380 [bacterium]|nr:hypothetical protein [bacterium]
MKIRSFILTVICSLSVFIDCYAQEKKISDIQTPPSPAFVLLGIEPNSISKPTTPRAVAASFVSSVQQGGALEVAPYWLASHPNLTFDDYYNAGLGQTIMQTLSISFATVPKTEISDTLGTRVGLGARWLLIAGHPRDSLKIFQKKLENILADMLDPQNSDQLAELEKERRELSLKIQKEDELRQYSVAMASAVSMNFRNDSFSDGKFDKWGVWITASYILEDPSVDLLAVARVIGNNKEEGTQNVFDFGGRIIASIHDFSLSCEYIQRTEINIDRTAKFLKINSRNFFLKNTYRLTGNVEYKYNDDVSVSLTFGRNYTNEKEDSGTLVAQVGLNLGFGKIPFTK